MKCKKASESPSRIHLLGKAPNFKAPAFIKCLEQAAEEVENGRGFVLLRDKGRLKNLGMLK